MKSIYLFIYLFLSSFLANSQGYPLKRAHHTVVYHPGMEKVILLHGSSPLDGGKRYNMFDDFWSFDGTTWTSHAIKSDARSGVAVAYDPKRKTFLSMGGYVGGGRSVGDLRILEGNEWKTITNDTAMATTDGGMVYDRRRDVFVAFGGSRSPRDSTVTWEWDRKKWKRVDVSGPGNRGAFAMFYDEKRKRVMLFGGGASRKGFNDLWEYDGKSWTQIKTENTPSERFAFGYAYDSKRQQLIIFGGLNSSGILSDTWVLNGNTWTQVATDGPSKRMMGFMAYDKKRDRVVLFGGRLGWPNDANDTWEWDGATWKNVIKLMDN